MPFDEDLFDNDIKEDGFVDIFRLIREVNDGLKAQNFVNSSGLTKNNIYYYEEISLIDTMANNIHKK